MKAYKCFNKDMTCRGFQFEEDKTYEEQDAKLCHSGFHACENPLDCFNYYRPANSVLHEVELDGVSDERHDDDTKVAAKKITVGARLDVAGIVKAHFEYVTARCKKVKGSVAGDCEAVAVKAEHACSAGVSGSASAGESGIASAGERGSASAGSWGSASAGYRGSASAGYRGVAACRGGKVKGGLGCLLACTELTDDGSNKSVAAALVDGEKIKPDTWYKVVDGNFVEVEA